MGFFSVLYGASLKPKFNVQTFTVEVFRCSRDMYNFAKTVSSLLSLTLLGLLVDLVKID